MTPKKVLFLFYSQTGQLAEIVESFSKPFYVPGVIVEIVRVKPVKDFGFPWTSERFFDAMPESVTGKHVEMQEIECKSDRYDLIVFGYQPWYLSPSIPAISILKNAGVQKMFKDTPVITLVGARNMWINAQEKVKEILKSLHAKHVGNVVLTDRNQNHVSAVTILHWMLKGRKDRYLGIFPKPGISDEDIRNAAEFGRIVLPFFLKDRYEGLQEQLVQAGAVAVKPDLMFIEHRAGRIFSVWARLVSSKKNRKAWLTAYKYYLLIALFGVAPVVLTVNNILFRHFFTRQINRKKNYYLGLN